MKSDCLLIKIAPENIAMFRFLLESYENMAFFTVLEPKTAILKLVFTPDQRQMVEKTLAEIALSVPFISAPWPIGKQIL